MAKSERDLLLSRWAALKVERESWIPHWREISRYLLPRSGRYFLQDRNRGERRHNNILDNTGTRALNTLAAGMMAGMTSPARPWFRLTTSVPELDESPAVKEWLANVTRLMLMVFAKSNTYRALHQIYQEMGAFGTAASITTGDFRNVIHNYTLTAGEYGITTDYQGRVDTLYREYQMTVAQMAREFGIKRCSVAVQNAFDQGNLETWVTVLHAIEPRADRDATKRDAMNMAWKSSYMEIGSGDGLLRESGFKTFPALCPRWAVAGGDVYGNGPGMEALGDLKQLQHEQLQKAKGISQKADPAVQIPSNFQGRDADLLPGGKIYVDSTQPGSGVRTAFEVSIDLSHLLADIIDVRDRIKTSFYADLFLMLANGTNPQMTATEVAERHEEKLLMLGPVLERMHNEILDPLIEQTFAQLVSANILPPPPPEMQGMDLNVEFVSMLAQAQRAIATNSVDRFVGNLGAVAGLKPDVLDKFDADRWADTYADMLGVDPDLIVPGDKVALIRQQRAQAAQAQQQAAMMNQGADTAAKLGGIDTSKPNALTDVTRAFSGYT